MPSKNYFVVKFLVISIVWKTNMIPTKIIGGIAKIAKTMLIGYSDRVTPISFDPLTKFWSMMVTHIPKITTSSIKSDKR